MMINAIKRHADIALENQTLHVSGDMHVSKEMGLYAKSLPLLAQHSAWQFDFSRLQSSDSAGLALIVEWVKLAKQQQKTIQLQHLSHHLQSLARVAGLERVVLGA
jgi:phospholipid transport system transporter-binding protein